MMQWLYHGLDTPVSYAPADRSKATADYNHSQYLRNLDALEARLRAATTSWAGRFRWSTCWPRRCCLSGLGLGGSVEGRQNIAAWLDRCRARPAFARIGGAG